MRANGSDPLRDPQLQNETFSGLLLLQSGGGKIDYADFWKLSGGQADANKYYWARSAKADRLTSIEAAGPGFLVVPKSGDKLNKKIFNATATLLKPMGSRTDVIRFHSACT